MLLWKEKTEIAIWGAGPLGERLYHEYRNKYDIKCFFDNDIARIGSLWAGKKICKYSKEKKIKILIASRYYKDIMEQLKAYNLHIYEDYLPYCLFEYESIDYFKMVKFMNKEEVDKLVQLMKKDKELVILHGNCQMGIIKRYLEHNQTFAKTRIILDIPRICNFKDEEITHLIKKEFWKECSLFISQEIRDHNRFDTELSTNKIYEKLPPVEKCKRIVVTNMFFTGYFPQLKQNEHNVLQNIHQSGAFSEGDSFIEKLFFEGKDTSTIVKELSEKTFLNKGQLEKYVEASFNELEIREEKCDVKMADYIRKFYKERQLFYSKNHPTNFLLEECTIRILKLVGIDDENFELKKWIEERWKLKGEDCLIYPFVIKQLNLKIFEKYYYPNVSIWSVPVTFAGYIEHYINICLKK